MIPLPATGSARNAYAPAPVAVRPRHWAEANQLLPVAAIALAADLPTSPLSRVCTQTSGCPVAVAPAVSAPAPADGPAPPRSSADHPSPAQTTMTIPRAPRASQMAVFPGRSPASDRADTPLRAPDGQDRPAAFP